MLVLAAFAVFAVTLAGTHLYTQLTPARRAGAYDPPVIGAPRPA